jgi:predicted dienelactone hydrolase
MTMSVAFVVAVLLSRALTVGFQQLTVADGSRAPLAVGIWYPSLSPAIRQSIGSFQQEVALNGAMAPGQRALILISHGTSGSLASHFDTALALARAGFVVAAVTHTGDNAQDQRFAGNVIDLTDRPRQVIRVLDFMLTEWSQSAHVDGRRVGMFGVSLGGFTALVAAGAMPRLDRMRDFCVKRPDAPECRFIAQRHGDQLQPSAEAPTWSHDSRIKAIVVAAPAASVLFDVPDAGTVKDRILLWRAEHDTVSPNEWNSDVVRRVFAATTRTETVPRADHYVFLPPCSDALAKQAPTICRDPDGVDRAAVHRRVNDSLVSFFKLTLG